MRARFPNPQSLLLPGMFVTAQFAQAIRTTAYPGPAASDRARSQGQRDFVGRRTGQHRGATHGRQADRTDWRQLGRDPGPRPGEKVITQGTANLKDGAKIKPVPATRAAAGRAPAAGARKSTPGSGGG